ncbi:Uncharacterized protein FWK35_00016360 [Aphis craccivora]|uniref:THAP-type domain-containing protein n=1 Tax=Aphis craccivora TaxID=307492 RepID=A0A6G0Y1Y5_APHCR|nr:Uncharacterized protein FWK35_00016360 [Aphis craccivora]
MFILKDEILWKLVISLKEYCNKEEERLISLFKWKSDDISSAISIRSISPKAYRFLRDEKKFPLPGLSTLRMSAAKFLVEPGILSSVICSMIAKVFNEKLTIISFDETYMSNRICYDKKNEQMLGPHHGIYRGNSTGLYIVSAKMCLIDNPTTRARCSLLPLVPSISLIITINNLQSYNNQVVVANLCNNGVMFYCKLSTFVCKMEEYLPKREHELMKNSDVCSKDFEPSQIIREWTSGHIELIKKVEPKKP